MIVDRVAKHPVARRPATMAAALALAASSLCEGVSLTCVRNLTPRRRKSAAIACLDTPKLTAIAPVPSPAW
jgi:hypothetical protein